MGGVNIKTTPEVISLFSKAAVDPDLNNYIYCLAIKHNHYTPEQAAWLESLSRFSTTNPTPDQMQKWQDTHPFPQKTPAERLEIK